MVPHTIDAASLACAGAKPNLLLASSRGIWQSLLLDHHEGTRTSDTFETHATPDVTLVVATRGKHRIEVHKNGRWHSAIYQPQAAGLTTSHERTRLRWDAIDSEKSFRTLHLYLPQQTVLDVAEEYRRIGAPLDRSPLSSLVFHDPAVAACAAALLNGLSSGAPDLYAEQACLWLVTHLLSRHAHWRKGEDTRRSPSFLTDKRLARVLDYMDNNLEKPIGLRDLAQEAGMSLHHFARCFREQTGSTPHAHLRDLRMALARRLLRVTDLNVAQIAIQCGYGSPAAFTAAFRADAGLSPRQYRANRP
jgi:AraC family transcriptional regulator